ncbi:hypothetical protein HYS94_00805 [Candidatus Daviesbacteria bacterium]|nr:hypothetical protein [Candidatus Daviesbacteria bacterium]
MLRNVERMMGIMQKEMGLSSVHIRFKPISQEQVTGDGGIIGHHLIGISRLDRRSGTATLYFTEFPTAETIRHELVHLRWPYRNKPGDHRLIDEETELWENGGRKWVTDWNGSLWVASQNMSEVLVNLQR